MMILINMKTKTKKSVSFANDEKWTVYGSKGCPWCVKQVEYFKALDKPYTFVDCESGKCPDFVEGFPTLMSESGKKHSGFTRVFEEVEEVKEERDTRVWKMYGSHECSWTVKQINYMRKHGKQFTFVDCDNEECKDIKGYPTLITPEGGVHNGYTEV
jgi:glutaredoxin-related protein